ncbi:hypothetical protein Fuma_01923 [Fuerstiella marisgermanici]|uniref:Uncharacterized protein n=1 Tax=Fuerstiella marisgermanici TaxID=1891926 RepID=A0A1P8WE22_9PLAN|nr:hypothetical protein Fuma_01923 [Fuerstiella marisgermanici]
MAQGKRNNPSTVGTSYVVDRSGIQRGTAATISDNQKGLFRLPYTHFVICEQRQPVKDC